MKTDRTPLFPKTDLNNTDVGYVAHGRSFLTAKSVKFTFGTVSIWNRIVMKYSLMCD